MQIDEKGGGNVVVRDNVLFCLFARAFAAKAPVGAPAHLEVVVASLVINCNHGATGQSRRRQRLLQPIGKVSDASQVAVQPAQQRCEEAPS